MALPQNFIELVNVVGAVLLHFLWQGVLVGAIPERILQIVVDSKTGADDGLAVLAERAPGDRPDFGRSQR